MTKSLPVVLATCDWYFPGGKGGGAMHALANMASRLDEKWKFKIITRDRDLGDHMPYDQIPVGCWYRMGTTDVMYLSPVRRLWMLLKWVRKTEFDVLYFNSFLSPAFTLPLLLFRKIGWIAARPLIVAPRGEFSSGALKIKRFKKNGYILLAKACGLCHDVIWHVSTVYEEADVRRHFGDKARIIVARDCLPRLPDFGVITTFPPKIKGQLDIVFLSRICRMKNLHGALNMLSGLQGSVRMRIYGPQEDIDYWHECQEIIAQLPANIHVEYCGVVMHDDVLCTLAQNHLFFLPTQGENFGFVIFEALLAGCPILISDQTPWRDLEAKGVGWDIPLAEPSLFCKTLQKCIDMDQGAVSMLSQKARTYGLQTLQDDPSTEQSIALFNAALN